MGPAARGRNGRGTVAEPGDGAMKALLQRVSEVRAIRRPDGDAAGQRRARDHLAGRAPDLASKKAERPELRIFLNKHRLPTK